MRQTPAFTGVFLCNLPDLDDVGLLLQVLLHKILELKRFVIQTFGEIFSKLICELRKHRLFLVLKKFEFVRELLFQVGHFFRFQHFRFIEILVMDEFFELFIPVKPQWLQFFYWKLVQRLLLGR